jgi:hypothetical protein
LNFHGSDAEIAGKGTHWADQPHLIGSV